MTSLKRNFVLSNKNAKNSEMALVTLEKLNHGVVGTLKTYQLNEPELTLCISAGNSDVFNKTVTLTNGVCGFNLDSQTNLNQPFACVLAKKVGNSFEPVVWDTLSEQGYKTNVITMLNKNVIKHSYQAPEKKPAAKLDLDELFELEDGNVLEKLIDDNLEQPKATLFASETDKIKENLKSGEVFYDLVSNQIQDIFNKFPSESKLENLISNSKWVKVDYENNGNAYVLGLIYDDVTLKYICYGVPGNFEENPPKDVENYSQWLPLNPDNVSEGGYWVMYQDAVTGDNIQIEFM